MRATGFDRLHLFLQRERSAGDLNSDELERIVTIIQNPTQFKIPTWFLNRQKDIVDGKNYQILSNGVDSKLRDDLERLKKIRAHRGLRHFWGLRVRGQHTKTTGENWVFSVVLTVLPYTQVVVERPLVCRRRGIKEYSSLFGRAGMYSLYGIYYHYGPIAICLLFH